MFESVLKNYIPTIESLYVLCILTTFTIQCTLYDVEKKIEANLFIFYKSLFSYRRFNISIQKQMPTLGTYIIQKYS